jgi:hypothetical protein
MATELIDGNTVRRVQNMLKGKGGAKVGKIYDRQSPGLTIRVYKATAAWAIVTRDWKSTIGPFGDYVADDVPMLRDLVRKARQIKSEGRDPEDLLAAFRTERDVALATARADVTHGIGDTWEHVRDAYLAWLAAGHRDKDTTRGYRSALGAVPGGDLEKDFEPVRSKPVVSISTKDLIRVRSNIVKRGKGGLLRQADLTVSALKSCFKWYLNQEDSLIETSPAQLLGKVMERAIEDETASPESERTMNQLEVGMLQIGLERERNAAARWSLTLQLFMGQRRLTPLEARKVNFFEHPAYGMTWRLGDKVNAWRVLPLSGTAVAAVRAAQALSAQNENPYLFPQQRPRRLGSPTDGHLSERRVSGVVEDMRLPGGVLHGLPFDPATHDLRRAFITVMGPRMSSYSVAGRALRPEDVEMITHESEGRKGTASAVYDKSEYLDVKAAILKEWEAWCLEGYRMAKASLAQPA